MARRSDSPITSELWIANLLGAMAAIADKEHQETRWLAEDARAWETPNELICTVDDCVFEGFLEKYAATFSEDQRVAALSFQDDFNHYCDTTPAPLDPAEVLKDSRWEGLRGRAAAFVRAFRDKWPPPGMPVD